LHHAKLNRENISIIIDPSIFFFLPCGEFV